MGQGLGEGQDEAGDEGWRGEGGLRLFSATPERPRPQSHFAVVPREPIRTSRCAAQGQVVASQAGKKLASFRKRHPTLSSDRLAFPVRTERMVWAKTEKAACQKLPKMFQGGG